MYLKRLASGPVSCSVETVQLPLLSIEITPLFVLSGDFSFKILVPEGTMIIILNYCGATGQHDGVLIISNAMTMAV